MPQLDQSATSVYGRFTVAQLRELALAARVPTEDVIRAKSHDDISRLLGRVTDKEKLAQLAHRVEALVPYKHCFLLQYAPACKFSDILNASQVLLPRAFAGFLPLESDTPHVHPQLCVVDKENERLFIKFAHMVDVWEQAPSADNQKLKVKTRKRHVLVATVYGSNSMVAISFPGFTQATLAAERMGYAGFVSEVTAFLHERLGVPLEPFQMKQATDLLLDDKTEGVVDLRRKVRFSGGGKMDLDSESDEDAASVLSHGLATSGIRITAADIRLALRQSEAHSMVLLWQKLQIITRVSLRYEVPEILFIWGEVDPSLGVIEAVLNRLARAREVTSSDGLRDATGYVASARGGEVIRPSWISQQFAIAQDAAIQILLEACASSAFRPVFRIKDEEAADLPSRRWVDNIERLPLSYVNAEGHVVDSLRPENIEVAFERLAS